MKTVLVLLAVSLFFTFANPVDSFAQDKKNKSADKQVEVMPEYPGGFSALIEKIISDIKYPEDAKNNKIQGKVLVEFTVDENGNVTYPHTINKLGSGLDEEAIRVVKDLKFIPGKNEGKNVAVELVLPIMFKLEEK